MAKARVHKGTPKLKAPPLVSTKTPAVLFSETQELIRKIQSHTNAPLFTFWQASGASIFSDNVLCVRYLLQRIGKVPHITLFLKTHGGQGLTSLRIVHLLRQYTDRLTVLLPLNCASAGTMLALGADEIHMGPLAYLTAVDSSIHHDLAPVDRDNSAVSVSNDELLRVIKLWQHEKSASARNPYDALYQYVHPLVIGAVDRMSSLSVKVCREILSYHLSDEHKASEIADRLNGEYPSHSYPITAIEARRIGLNIHDLSPELDDALLQLNELYSHMGQSAITDYDLDNYHNNEIRHILECDGLQMYYQHDKDWVYRREERRWVSKHDKTAWHRVGLEGKRLVNTTFEVR